jgi:hypothetical protein
LNTTTIANGMPADNKTPLRQQGSEIPLLFANATGYLASQSGYRVTARLEVATSLNSIGLVLHEFFAGRAFTKAHFHIPRIEGPKALLAAFLLSASQLV